MTAVVTGAAGGIGAALAERLAAEHDHVILADVDGERLEAVAGRLGATAIEVDVADASAWDAIVAAAGTPDLLCLNAGVLSSELGPPWAAGPDEWQRVLAVNVGGVVNGLRAFVPRLLERDEPAAILVTASLAGVLTWPGGGPYAASKHAVLAVAEQAALALADTPITVTALCPALVRTGMSDVGADPGDVADRALAAVAEGRFAVVDPEWAPAIHARADALAGGGPVEVPLPGTG